MDRYLLPEPLPATGNLPEQWARFKKQIEQFLDASEKSGVSDKAKIAILLRTIGDKGNDIYENFVFEANEQPTFDDVLAQYEQFCKPRISVFAARHQFLTMTQNNQTIDEFLTALKKQVRDCAFGELKDDMVLHALTLGLDNDRTRRRLFETQKLTLDKAVNLCRLTEDTETEMRRMKINEEVSAVYKTKVRTHDKTPAKKSQGPTYSQADHVCDKCARKHPPGKCAAFGRECYLCRKANHFAKCCRSGKTAKRVHMVEDAESDSDILHIQVDKVGKKLVATINVHHADSGDTELRCQLDTAASCNVLSVSDYEKLGSPTLMPSSTTLTMYDGSKVQSKGRCHLNLRESGQAQTLMFEAVETKNATLLSLDTCLQLQLSRRSTFGR